MNTRQLIDFNRISEAIDHLKNTFRNQPNLEDLAMKTNISSFHFQRLFHEWAGTTPKKFLQYISIEHAKNMLKEKKSTLVDTAFETGLSGTGRLHDLFINIEGMTPAEYKNGGSGLLINYSFAESLFGNIVVASTTKGICYLAFYDDETIAFSLLQKQFPNAAYCCKLDLLQQNALYIFQKDCTSLDQVKLHLKGSPFQLKVWEALLKIPMGKLSSYGSIAKKIDTPNASRAVGTAIGSNPVAYLIPCHRVIQSSGILGGYMWGNARKEAIIGWEAAQSTGV